MELIWRKDYRVKTNKMRANNACSGLGGGPCKKEESKRKLFSVSMLGSRTKPLTRAVRQHANSLRNSLSKWSCGHRPVPPTLVVISFCLQQVELRVQISILGDVWQVWLACKSVIMAAGDLARSVGSCCFHLAPRRFSELQVWSR